MEKKQNSLAIALGITCAVLLVYSVVVTVKYRQAYDKSWEHFNNYVAEWQINQELAAKIEQLTPSSAGRTYTLENGNYVAGVDFLVGTYDITAVKGGGNVMSDMGAINAIMGVDDDGFYQRKYSNITFAEGETLTIRDVKIKLLPR